MADKEGRVTLAGKHLKSLVSYGVSYDDDEDDDEDDDDDDRNEETQTASLAANTSKRSRQVLPTLTGKRQVSDSTSGDGQPQHKKKFFMAFGSSASVTQKVSPGPVDGSGTSGIFTMKMVSSKLSADSSKPLACSTSSSGSKPAPIKLSLSGQNKVRDSSFGGFVVKKSSAVARAFEDEESDENEDMPADARMRMRNIGRETPTAAGPNSFGKGRLGFCDRQKMIERQLEKRGVKNVKSE